LPETDIFYFHPDHLGSTSYITGKNGEITQHCEYIAFGEVLFEEHSSSFSSPYLFNGKELDRETNLSYYGARYLDMKASLWLNVDPLALYNPIKEDQFYYDGEHNGGVYNGRNLSYYGYCYQNPIMYFDPNGKQSKFWTRTFGGLQMVGGVVEAVFGGVGGIVTSETGVGAVVGYAILANGCDNTVTGFNQMISGESQTTLLHKGVKATAIVAGATEKTADNWGTAADISTIALGGVGSLSKAPGTTAKVIQEGEGVYNLLTSGGRYVGQSKNFLARVAAHFSGRGKLTNFTKITEEFHLMSGSSKYEREIYEQYLINKSGGIDNLINVVNPVGGRFNLKTAEGLKEFAKEAIKVIEKYNLPN
jgi:RHS repeat-associated protein